VRRFLFPALAAASFAGMLFVPPIRQDPAYHNFADQRTMFGIPNFWNVVSNLPFLLVVLLVALRALRSGVGPLPWPVHHRIFLFGVGAVTFGSAYYHAWPSDATLFWDRLPMTVAFMALFAAVIGEGLSPSAGRTFLFPLLVFGAASVFYWRLTGDLRLYVLVQFFPMLAIPLIMILCPPNRIPNSGLIGLMLFYALAKLLEWQDHAIANVISTGGHPWKHLAAAAAVLWYIFLLEPRKPL
jgi:hypothetical protein